jgi:hypothetical protein
MAEELRHHRIEYLVVPDRYRGLAFNSANFPKPFIDALGQLAHTNRVQPIWDDGVTYLLRTTPN